MNKQKDYYILITTGELQDEHLTAEIYSIDEKYLYSVHYNGTHIVLNFTCDEKNEICRNRTILLSGLVDSLNEALMALKLEKAITIQLK